MEKTENLIKTIDKLSKKENIDSVDIRNANINEYFEIDVENAKKGDIDSCKIIAAYLYKKENYEQCLKWLEIAYELGGAEVIFIIIECKEKIESLQKQT